MPNLHRFIEAQDQTDSGLQCALDELKHTGKESHWIWYVFPQLAGLGFSSMSRRYAIADVGEAVEYLRDPILRQRLLAVTEAVAEQVSRGVSVERVMGSSVDTVKLVSSLTLFGKVAARLDRLERLDACRELVAAADRVLAAAAAEGYPECRHTLRLLC